MGRHPAVILSAAISMAAFGLSGCGEQSIPQVPQQTVAESAAQPGSASERPLPAPEALTDVLARLADVTVPGEQKIALVQYATPEDAAALDRFGKAVNDSGVGPLVFNAGELAWSSPDEGDVVATVTVTAQVGNPPVDTEAFTFPMTFTPVGDSWQLTRETAEQLFDLAPPAAPAEPPR